MSAPKISLFTEEGPPRAAPVRPSAAAPVPASVVTPDEGNRRILSVAIADTAAALVDMALLLNQPRTDHTTARLNHVLQTLARIRHRVEWARDGKMPEDVA